MRIYCIIPVYNVCKYLPHCIDSVLTQDYDDFRIVLVDDCSTDGSVDVCQKYQKRFPDKIYLIRKTINEGVDKARFTGLQFALQDACNIKSGGLIFLDSDDYISKNTFNILSSNQAITNADIVQMHWRRIIGPIKRKGVTRLTPRVIEASELMDKYYISFFGINILDVNIWGKLYDINLLRRAKLQPSGYKMGEDLIFNMRLLPYVNRYSIIDYCGYNYRIGGLTSRFNPTLWADLSSQFLIKREEALSHDYTKALHPLTTELKNILISSIEQRIVHLNESYEQLTQWVDRELSRNELWQDIHLFSNDANPVFSYIANRNSSAIIELAKSNVKKTRSRRQLKTVLSKFF